MLQADSEETQPLPVETHPVRNDAQTVFVANVVAASVQAKGLHTVEPAAVFAVHGPSEPIIPAHPFACVYELHAPSAVAQPFPVVRHPTIHPLH